MSGTADLESSRPDIYCFLFHSIECVAQKIPHRRLPFLFHVEESNEEPKKSALQSEVSRKKDELMGGSACDLSL
jgi:hypothetical protein